LKPAPFRYERPETVAEVVALLAEHGDEAKVLAGGQSLVPLLNMRMARPEVVVDINHVVGLDNISPLDGAVRCGALVRQGSFAGASPLVDRCLPHIGHFVTRNRGTVCGSIAHADASAELPLALLVSGGSVVAASSRGRRTIAAEDFFVTHFTTALEPEELLVESVWPDTGPAVAFAELAQRRGDYALCMAAATAGGGGVRVGVASVTDRPTLLEIDLDRPGESAAEQVETADGLHASAGYLRRLVAVLVDRVVAQARGSGT
jgi:2-furoyl-CoA dehydrogenase FAD binding subunit